jgi:peroxin-6
MLFHGMFSDFENVVKVEWNYFWNSRFDLPEEINLDDIIDMCPENLTGADFYALCSNALLNAIRRQILDQESGMHAWFDLSNNFSLFFEGKWRKLYNYPTFCFVVATKAGLTQQDFELAIENLVPSVSDVELRHYEKIQWEFNKNKQAEKEVDVGELELDGRPQPETILW